MKVKDILAEKGTDVATITGDTTVWQAMNKFAAQKVGSLLVLGGTGNIIGIIAARDVLMSVLKHRDKLDTMPVSEIMTKDIIVASPDDDLDYVEAIMTENRIRHVPIIENKALAGIVSIGDLVKAQLKQTSVENRYLRDFIEGKYPA
ncbi:CBS domain-containing protein [candidate division KSB1 bacterium]|nr:CBS domain-containing protein [candidate division KSB1 bacterium]